MHVMHYVASLTEQLVQRMEGSAPENIVPTGFASLDDLFMGFAEGDLIILAARPSMGKTALSLAITDEAANQGGRNVLYFSTEQSGLQLAYRKVASASRVPATDLRRGTLAGGDFDRVVDGARQVGDTNLWIDEQSEITLPEIRAKSRVFAQKHPKPLIVVDYLQRVAAHRQADPRVIIGEISTGLKNLAKELGAPVIALAQLNRELEKRTNKRPMMSDLGESGKIEQDADIILFIYRDEVYNADTKEPGITEVIAGKNRDGQVGIRKLAFSGRTLRYEDLSHV
jgi:replicative DNA helicase